MPMICDMCSTAKAQQAQGTAVKTGGALVEITVSAGRTNSTFESGKEVLGNYVLAQLSQVRLQEAEPACDLSLFCIQALGFLLIWDFRKRLTREEKKTIWENGQFQTSMSRQKKKHCRKALRLKKYLQNLSSNSVFLAPIERFSVEDDVCTIARFGTINTAFSS